MLPKFTIIRGLPPFFTTRRRPFIFTAVVNNTLRGSRSSNSNINQEQGSTTLTSAGTPENPLTKTNETSTSIFFEPESSKKDTVSTVPPIPKK